MCPQSIINVSILILLSWISASLDGCLHNAFALKYRLISIYLLLLRLLAIYSLNWWNVHILYILQVSQAWLLSHKSLLIFFAWSYSSPDSSNRHFRISIFLVCHWSFVPIQERFMERLETFVLSNKHLEFINKKRMDMLDIFNKYEQRCQRDQLLTL